MNEISIQNALVAHKPALIGKTISIYNWEMTQPDTFINAINWLDDNFYYMVKAEALSLAFFIYHVR